MCTFLVFLFLAVSVYAVLYERHYGNYGAEDVKMSENKNEDAISGNDKIAILSVDKAEYERGEMVRISLKNNSDKTIFFARKTGCDLLNNIEKETDGVWKNVNSEVSLENSLSEYQLKCFDAISYNDFQYSETEPRSAVFRVELDPGETYEDLWDLTINNKFIGEGKYKIGYSYGFSQDTLSNINKYMAYSEGFVIKGRFAANLYGGNDVKTISVSQEFPEANLGVELYGPERLVKNKDNQFRVILRGKDVSSLDLNKISLNAGVRFNRLSSDDWMASKFMLSDEAYSKCEKSADKLECVVSITPRCFWDNDIHFHIAIKRDAKPYNLDSPYLLLNIFNRAIETCGNGIDDNCDGDIDGLDEQCNLFTLYVAPGEGVTNICRRAIAQYLEKKYSASFLNSEQKIYAEDYMRRKYTDSLNNLKAGQQIDFMVSDIENAIQQALDLSSKEINSLERFKDIIDYTAYKFISKSDSVAEVANLWGIDDKTKISLEAAGDYWSGDGGAWKTDTASGDIIVYYENANIKEIDYVIGVYMKKDEYREGMMSHAARVSRDGIVWEEVEMGYRRDGKEYYPNTYIKSGNNLDGTGIFFLDVADYNKGRLYVKFTLNRTKDADATLSKNIMTNLDMQ